MIQRSGRCISIKRKHKIEAAAVAALILACLAVLVYQLRFKYEFLYKRMHLHYERKEYDKAMSLYIKFLSRFAKGRHLSETRQELFSANMTVQISKEGRFSHTCFGKMEWIPGMLRINLEDNRGETVISNKPTTLRCAFRLYETK